MPWALFAVAMVCFTVLDATSLVGGPDRGVILREVLKGIGYSLTIVALVVLIYSRKTGRDRASLIDSGVIVIGVGTVSWIFLMAPFATDSSIPLSERISDLTDPVALLVLLSVSVRLAMSPGARTPSFWFLTTAMLLSFSQSWLDIGLRPEIGSLTDRARDATGIFVFVCAGPERSIRRCVV